jgi:hypothetical protein
VVTEDLVWVLCIRNPATQEVIGRTDYEHQTFALRAGQVMNPTFHENLEMLPGVYQVTVALRSARPLRYPDGSTGDAFHHAASFHETVK